jgi:hypothetical protein
MLPLAFSGRSMVAHAERLSAAAKRMAVLNFMIDLAFRSMPNRSGKYANSSQGLCQLKKSPLFSVFLPLPENIFCAFLQFAKTFRCIMQNSVVAKCKVAQRFERKSGPEQAPMAWHESCLILHYAA